MKPISLQRGITLAALLVMTATAGCGKSDPAPTSPTTKTSMSAKVDGVDWSATSVTARYQSNVIGALGSRINGANNKQISFDCLATGPGTYTAGGPGGVFFTYTEITNGVSRILVADSGAITVQELTATGAKGTFAFELSEQLVPGGSPARHSITNGKFEVTF